MPIVVIALAWACLTLTGCTVSQHERAAFHLLGKCDAKRDGAAWCESVNRPWGQRL